MRTTISRLLLLALCLMMPAMAMAQAKALLPDSNELPKAVEDYMGVKSTQNDAMKNDVRQFCEKLSTGTFSDADRTEIVSLMNNFIKKRATPTPHMHNLIRAINGFWKQGKNSDFKPWADFVNDMVTQSTISMAKVNEVTNFTANLMETNSLETTSAKSWYMNNSNFKIKVGFADDGQKSLLVEFGEGDLRLKMLNGKTKEGKTKYDSTLVIYGTSGVYNFATHTFSGKKGKIDWSRGNISPDSIYAVFQKFEVDTRGTEFDVETADFYNKKYFSSPIKGQLHEKTVLNSTGEKARFPQFKSHNSQIQIKNLAKDIDYVGGYAQNGVLFYGQSTDTASYSKLIFKYKDEPLIIAEGQSFVFGLKKLESSSAKITINLHDGKKITHPGVKLKYDSETEQLQLFRGNTAMENANYEDNYHNITFDVNQIEWLHNDTVMYLCTRLAAPRKEATFESYYYFSHSRYDNMMGMDKSHPLITLRDCEESMCCKTFTAKDLQRFLYERQGLGLNITQVHQMLLNMSFNGFVTYDPITREASLTQKTYNYIACHSEKFNYDVISITSNAGHNNVNATLNLNNMDLTIFKAKPFLLSEKRQVKVLPDTSVVMHKELNMEISGKIQAGLSDFYGKDFKFDYNKFVIDIPKSDSMAMLTINYNEETKKNEIDSVKSVFENITGTLMIDDYANKSGSKSRNDLPKLITKDTSHVYYDNLISGDYSRDKFYMEVYPFALDSMNHLSLNGVKAKGKFVSGIFPDLEVTLTVQEDQSLGFDLPTPPNGYELYDGKGKFNNRIMLNAEGLTGDGDLKYLTALAKSEKFKFFPDSVEGHCYSMNIDGVNKSQIGSVPNVMEEYPDMVSSNCNLLWLPHKDVFSSISKDTALALYGKSVDFNGTVALTPNGMTANGELLYFGTGTFSNSFNLRNSTYDAAQAVFCNFDKSHPGDTSGYFYTDQYDINMDFNKQSAQFVSKVDTARVHFPQHKYRQLSSFFEWKTSENAYQFGHTLSRTPDRVVRTQKDYQQAKQDGLKPLWGGVTMVSSKDSLRYDAFYASFKNEENVIHVHEPGEIVVVDSRIDPSGIIDITTGGQISKFENAVINASRDSMFHKIINTTVKIRDKYYFRAVGGQYEYNGSNQGITYLDLDTMEIRRVKLDTAASAPKKLVSIGYGSVKEEQQFMLSPQFKFEGRYSFMGIVPGIKFNGYSYIQQTCDSTVRPFRFEGNINPDNVLFPVSERVIDPNKRRLYTGFFFNEDSLKIYPIFMGHKWNTKDSVVLTASKGLTYNNDKHEFRIAPRRRLTNEAHTDNYVVLYKNLCDMYGEGDINTNANIAPVQLATKGEIYYSRDLKSFSISTMLSLNFHVRNDVMKMMSDEINDAVNLRPMNLMTPKIKRRLEFAVGNDTVRKMLDNYQLTGEVGKIPNGLQKTIVLGDVQLYWDSASYSYKSKGDIGVAFINGALVDRYMPGKVQIVHNRKRGDQITIYLQASSTKWFYFNYNAGYMYCLSSIEDFNNKIIGTKEKERVKKIDKLDYQYVIGAVENKSRFLRAFTSDGDSPEIPNEQERSRVNQDIEGDAADPTLPDSPVNNKPADPTDNGNGGNSSNDDDDSDFVLEDDTTPEDDSQSSPAIPGSATNEKPAEQPTPADPGSATNNTPASSDADDDEEPDFIDE